MRESQECGRRVWEAWGDDTVEGQLLLGSPLTQPSGAFPSVLGTPALVANNSGLMTVERPPLSIKQLLKAKHCVTLSPLLLGVHHNPVR